ncbi:DUF4401 domain-containing protein [uncultured Cedecea sp.]|uniref:DUF4401 domain-containing protein n=1 Tax=uncultured Cedecea sp. TaxID=988762 RepID=UPI0026233575|nr:DUF4401 domain-containing protein [uncultured Cedecea sp.]
MDLSPHQQDAMPSRAAKRLCDRLFTLVSSPPDQHSGLTVPAYRHILWYCGVRPDLTGWRSFLTVFLTLLGLMALVAGTVFFIAWNWAAMPKMVKFALAQLFIIVLAIVVWWRWYDAVARMALLAAGLSFGGLFALYGQVYQTGADSWELFFTWACVLFPLALLGRQNALWFCTWVIANLAFQLYYLSQITFFFDAIVSSFLSWLPNSILYGYLIVQIALLLIREALAEYAARHASGSWLVSRWCSRVMAAYLLLTLTSLFIRSLWEDYLPGLILFVLLGGVLVTGYFYYRYRRPDLCMLTFGVISLIAVGDALIIRFIAVWDIGTLFISGVLMVLLLIAGFALLLFLRRKLPSAQTTKQVQNDEASLIQELRQSQLLNEAQREALEKHDCSTHLPWYLLVTLVTGCWVAALIILFLLLLFLYVTDLFDDLLGIGLIVPSLIIAVLARMMLRTTSIGKQHIGLAWAIAATCGLCISVYSLVEPRGVFHGFVDSILYLPVIILMAIAMPNRLYRIMAVVGFVFLFLRPVASIISAFLSTGFAQGPIVLLVAGIVALWIWGLTRQEQYQTATRQEWMSALLYGIPIGLGLQSLAGMQFGILGEIFGSNSFYSGLSQGAGVGIAVGLIGSACVHALAFRTPACRIYLPAAMLCGAMAIFAPGIGLGLIFVLVARYQGSKGLLVSAGCFLMWYLSNWYYSLDVTLLYKSQLLFISGLLLLSLAWAARQWLPATSGETHAN